jgi:hypothetical protein
MSTTFDVKCEILGDLWIEYKGDPQFEDFISYNDLGLPLAFAIFTGVVISTPKAQVFVEETFELLLEALSKTDEGFDSLEDILGLTE